jgi:hypothetical protein
VSAGGDRSPPQPRSVAWLHLLNGAILIGQWVFTVVVYEHLPDQIPGHIGTRGVTRWEPRESGMWFLLPIMATLHAGLFYAIATLAGSSPGAGVNVPQRKRILTLPPEGQRYAMQPFRVFMYGLATWLLLLTGYLQFTLYRIAVAAQHGEPQLGGLLGVIMVFLVAVAAGAWWLSRAGRRHVERWEAWQARSGRPGDGG